MHSHRMAPWLTNHGAHTKLAHCYALGAMLEFPSTALKKGIIISGISGISGISDISDISGICSDCPYELPCKIWTL